MEPGSPISITETVWYGLNPQSPVMPEAPGLMFRLVSANTSDGSTIALLGAYNLGSPFIEYYGGQLPRPIRVVAINMQTGQVYQSDLNGPDHPPIMLEVTDEELANAPPGWSTESSHFNVDLVALLGLPQEAASYRVFLWLDNMISNVEIVNVLENMGKGVGSPTERPPLSGIQFDADPTHTQTRADEVYLRLIKEADRQLLQGAWYPAAITHPTQPVVWLLVTSQRDRGFGWLSLNANDVPVNLSPAVFRVDVRELLELTDTRQKVFGVAMSASAASQVLVFPVP